MHKMHIFIISHDYIELNSDVHFIALGIAITLSLQNPVHNVSVEQIGGMTYLLKLEV